MKLKALLAASVASLLTAGAIALAQTPGVNNNFPIMWNMVWEASTTKPTYSASANGITPVSSGQDICTLAGSSTKTIRVRRILFGGSAATTAVTEPVAILKRSTASTGAGTAMTKVAYDSQSSAASASLVEVWTANPTAGTLVGALADIGVQFLGQGTYSPAYEFRFGTLGSAAVLRGTAQSLSVNVGGVTLTGTLSCTFEWTEESP